MIMLFCLVGFVIFAGLCFAQICSRHTSNSIRGSDRYGRGAWKALRQSFRQKHTQKYGLVQLPREGIDSTLLVFQVRASLNSLNLFYYRGSRTHNGIDVICNAGSSVYAPFSAKVIRESRPYGNGRPHDTGIYMVGTGYWTGKYFRMTYGSKLSKVRSCRN